MASIIKVDQIQTAAGGTPTAADLGLNVTGNVINVTHGTAGGSYVDSSTFSTSSTSYTDSGISFSVTKSESNSKIVVGVILHFNHDFSGVNHAGSRHQFYEAGDTSTSLFMGNPTDGPYFFKNHGTSLRWDWYNQMPFTFVDDTTATGTRTYKWYAHTVSHGNVRGGRIEYIAYEIAG